ncbi:MAG: TylF/MycF/NovP-related O-methyltransferase [Terriglobales bacterium]
MKRAFRGVGLEIGRVNAASPDPRKLNPDIRDFEWETWQCVQPFTMTSMEAVIALIRAVEHVLRSGIPGDFVECGVWRGGSAMAIARTLARSAEETRNLYLYDTFTGMVPPTDVDVSCDGEPAAHILSSLERIAGERNEWAYATLEDVLSNLGQTALPRERIKIVQGPVERTIPATMPEQIAVLRLDTDWYESTRHELAYLYPRLSRGGILIIDDYGHWQGARRAVDEYFGDKLPFLNRVDYTCRQAVKPDDNATRTKD